MPARLVLLALPLLGGLAVAAPASAAVVVRVEAPVVGAGPTDVVTVTADPGERDDLRLVLRDRGVVEVVGRDRAPLAAGSCERAGRRAVTCADPDVGQVLVDLADRDDALVVVDRRRSRFGAPVTLDGGPGRDVLTGRTRPSLLGAVRSFEVSR